MTTRHHYLPTSVVTEGMVLAEDLLDKLGHMLLPAQTCLSERMLAAITQHGIAQLSIALPPLSEQEAQSVEEQQLARVAQLFRVCATSAPSATLHNYIIQYRKQAGND